MRIVRLANFITPSSGGLRTGLRELGKRYAEAGHQPVLVMPGPGYSDLLTEQGRVITLPGPKVPGMHGYRILLRQAEVKSLLRELKPDSIEVSDRSTLRWTGKWARANGVRSVMVSHESLEGLLKVARIPGSGWLSRQLNRRTARGYDRILCTTAWAAREFAFAGAANVSRVPLGVDLEFFHPSKADSVLRSSYAKLDEVLLVCCTRLSPEKRPERALTTLKSLLAQGVKATMVIAGDGPSRSTLERKAAHLPVSFTGWVSDRERLARLLATADVVVAPGPIETFGLAALEALSGGTPTVVSASSALPDVVGDAGVAVHGDDMSAGVMQLLARPEQSRRQAARARAEQFSWDAAAAGFLAVHESLG